MATTTTVTDAYCIRACKKCKSESLDYGSKIPWTPKAIAEYNAWCNANPDKC